jgi:uncharacterized protein (TIGR02597 family)
VKKNGNFPCSGGSEDYPPEAFSPMRLLVLSVVFASMGVCAPLSRAQTTAASEPVGFTSVSCLSNSDTYVSLPFTRAPEFVGAIAGTTDGSGTGTINMSGTTGWSSNQFVYGGTQHNHYYALIGPGGGAKEGHTYNITGNSATALTVDTSADNLGSIPANTQVLVIPHWTLATVFPASDAAVSFTPTTSSATYKTQILPNFTFPGSNLPAGPAYFFSSNVDGTTSNTGWRMVGDNTTDHGDDVITPNSYFVVRNNNNAPTLPFNSVGSVLTKKFATLLTSSSSQIKDNAAAMIRPVDVALTATGLSPADGSFVATTMAKSQKNDGRIALKDQLLLFDNRQVAMNKAPAAVYYYLSATGKATGWKLSGDGLSSHDSDVIPAGTALVIRKAKTPSNQSVFWVNAPTY